MAKTSFLRSLVAVAAFLAAGGAALAQSAECQRFRAELAALERSGGRTASGEAENIRVEIGRLVNYYRSIGCERGPLGFLAGPPPAECGAIAQRIRQMEANFARLSAQSYDSGDFEFRRRQLMAAIQQTCSAEPPRGFFESLFGPPRGQPQPQIMPEGQPIITEDQPAYGGRKLICVRTGDGSFFPLSVSPGGREGANEMCQALCPGTETIAFAYPGGDDGLNRAVSVVGNRPYTSLPSAFKFRKSFDPAVACKKDNESWAVVLRRAESMLEQRKGDIIVTAEKAEEMSRPKVVQARKAAEKKTDEEAKAAAETAASAPTASKESAGIGPKSIETGRVIAQTEGAKREVVLSDGKKHAVRVIAPELIPVPNAN
ncbi:DUF2865 domain-containing protein [Microvirga thermotolerans]|uniref:DUF2865 domain-containing protein n=1 Tax=Microvirga thermotolerans TaxID=2651334 RepID=A0A5P9JXQ2_9HYPH|nr:DUF2865 domain-containing protein [Microvirga thermotolerans]QFU17019.1 DUF2865 domain-containing protein [Microvirga thermotolerans]